ncbi:MAG: TonB-dependent receptor [Hyphomonas sp.]|uniref:TonB-dependent receptor n=1 Tax=Hyphomonas sp. TaxID=87 RepID=UPI0035281D3C
MKTSLMKHVSLVALAGGAVFAAAAQDATTTEDTELRAQTITVTATRRAGDVQDIPLNIAAVGASQIEEQGFDELSDVLAFVPGINVVDRGGRQGNPIIVRGLNADPIGPGDGNNDGGGTVATYLGEIPVFVDLKLNDLERVEVLLGPQGTLYGAGTLGGAIRYIPTKPKFDTEEFQYRAELSQYSEADSLSYETGVTFNIPIAKNFAIRGSIDYEDDSGFIDQPFLVNQIGVSKADPDFTDPADVAANLHRAEDVDWEKTTSGRIAARWEPVSWLDGTLTYYFQQADIGGRRISSKKAGLPVPVGDYENALRVPEPNKISNNLLALEVVADLGFAELTSASGWSHFEDDGQRDQTDLLIGLEYSYEAFPTFTAFTKEIGEEDRFNQEIRLVSTTDGPFNWIVGGYYNKLESANSSSEFTPFFDDFAQQNFCDTSSPAFPDDCYVVLRGDDLEYYSVYAGDLTEKAIFGELGYDLTDKWTVTVGARYYEYELKEYSATWFPLIDPDFGSPMTLNQIGDQALTPSQSDNGTLFKFNTSYDVTDDILVYATVSEGYRIGNSNGLTDCLPYDPNLQQNVCAYAPGVQFGPNPGDVAQLDERAYGPDKTTNYEIGGKTTLLNGRLLLNGAVYFVEWSDPQVSSATINGSQPITVNAGGAESKGVELSANWQATEAWSLRGSFSHVKAELTDDVPSLVRSISPPGFGTVFEDGKAGDRLPGSPETQFSVFTSYVMPVASGRDLTFNAGYSYQSDVLTRTGNRGGAYTVDGFGMTNASVVYNAANWSATLFANNLFDEYIETGARSTQLSNQVVPDWNGDPVYVRSFYTNVAAPRTIGVRFVLNVG